jgi:hypothetical protein
MIKEKHLSRSLLYRHLRNGRNFFASPSSGSLTKSRGDASIWCRSSQLDGKQPFQGGGREGNVRAVL